MFFPKARPPEIPITSNSTDCFSKDTMDIGTKKRSAMHKFPKSACAPFLSILRQPQSIHIYAAQRRKIFRLLIFLFSMFDSLDFLKSLNFGLRDFKY